MINVNYLCLCLFDLSFWPLEMTYPRLMPIEVLQYREHLKSVYILVRLQRKALFKLYFNQMLSISDNAISDDEYFWSDHCIQSHYCGRV